MRFFVLCNGHWFNRVPGPVTNLGIAVTARSRRHDTGFPNRIPNSEIILCLVSETFSVIHVNSTKHTATLGIRKSIRKTPVSCLRERAVVSLKIPPPPQRHYSAHTGITRTRKRVMGAVTAGETAGAPIVGGILGGENSTY